MATANVVFFWSLDHIFKWNQKDDKKIFLKAKNLTPCKVKAYLNTKIYSFWWYWKVRIDWKNIWRVLLRHLQTWLKKNMLEIVWRCSLSTFLWSFSVLCRTSYYDPGQHTLISFDFCYVIYLVYLKNDESRLWSKWSSLHVNREQTCSPVDAKAFQAPRAVVLFTLIHKHHA